MDRTIRMNEGRERYRGREIDGKIRMNEGRERERELRGYS